MGAADKVVKRLAGVFGNDIDAGAATSLYCISEPIPPGAYVGIEGRWGLKGGPVMIGRSAVACDYEAAARLVEFAEKETGTSLSL
jgi:hypothetical protein